MKIAGNKISNMLHFYREHLSGIYSKEEIDELCSIAFEHVLGLSKTEFHKQQEERINQSELIILYDMAKALATHKPIQYITHTAYFYGLKFYVDHHVLIPRPETEELVDLIIRNIKQQNNKQPNLLDIGTGSGCIPVSIKKNAPGAVVYAIDISEEALEVAKKNAQALQADVHFIQADILSAQTIDSIRFDYIVSNPPYIAKSESAKMEKNVLDYEPHLALFVENDDPLLFYRKIADFALSNLNDAGKLFFEINQQLAIEVKALLESKGFKDVQAVKDINGNDRIVWCVKPVSHAG